MRGPDDARVISKVRLRDALARAGFEGVSLHLFDELPSTSRWLEERACERAETISPSLCATDLQSDGSGRRGKGWVSLPGNVAMSLLERVSTPIGELSGLSLVTGIAVAEVLRETTGIDVAIKWPNDLLVGSAKIGGLLTNVQACPPVLSASESTEQSTTTPSGDPARESERNSAGRSTLRSAETSVETVRSDDANTVVITGVGINLVKDPRLSSLGIGGTSFADLGVSDVDRDRMLAQIAARLMIEHAAFLEAGWPRFAERWHSLDALQGREVIVLGQNGNERAQALGVNDDGALRVRMNGREQTLYSGEVSIRPVGG